MLDKQQMMRRASVYRMRTGEENFRSGRFALLTRKGGSWSDDEVDAISQMFAMVIQITAMPEYLLVESGIGRAEFEHVLGCDNFDFYETQNRQDPKLPF